MREKADILFRFLITLSVTVFLIMYHSGHPADAPDDLFAYASEAEGPWKDGVYEGTGEGYGGDITLTVTIVRGWMAQVTITDARGEDKPYLRDAKAILPQVLRGQHTDLDAISGATTTTWGILDAIDAALKEATP